MQNIATIDIAKLPRDVDALLGIIAQLHSQYATILESLHLQLKTMQRMHFGARSERLAGQPDLFDEKVSLPMPPTALESISYERKKSKGRPKLPENLPRTRIDYDLSTDEKAEFEKVEKIGEEISETLDFIPAKVTVIEHVRAKYRCEKDGESTIRTAFAEPSPLAKSNASAGLLAHILTSTFADHLPLNRQEGVFKRHGINLPRSTLCEWKLGAGELLYALIPSLVSHVLAAPRIHSDDTTMPLIESGRGCTKTARLWGYLGAGARLDAAGSWVEHPKAVVFEFTDSRESAHPIKFLQNYCGYLQADAYSGYDALYRTGRIIEVGCWAHARRKFFEIAKAQKQPGLADDAVAWIARLYEIESRIKGRPPDEKLTVRQAEAVPLLSDFKCWLMGHYPTLLPQGPLGVAFGYALRHWDALVRYTDSGVLLPDNNLLESALRPIAVGRRGYLFVAAKRGGHVAATLYSLIGTCKLNGIEPYVYLKDVLTRLPSHPVNRLAELLPFNWKPSVNIA